MTWDDDKDTFQSRPDVPDDEKITSAEWNAHTDDQKDHSDRHESGGSDELSVAGLSGVLADAQDPQTEAVQDIVGGLLAGGTNITTTYDDGNNILTVDTSALDQEEVEDAVAALVTAGNAITVNYDDPNDTLSVGVNESALSFYDGTNLTADVDNTSVTTDSLSTEGLTLGETGPVSGLFGDSGEWVPLTTIENGENTSTTTSNVFAFGSDIGTIPFSKISITGFDTFGMSLVGVATNDTAGSEVTVELSEIAGGDIGDAEVTVNISNGGDLVPFSGPIAPINQQGDTAYFYRVKVSKGDGGTARTGVGLILWGKIA